MGDITRNPLCWPDNVTRRAPGQRSRPDFSEKSISYVVGIILAEINRLNQRRWDYNDEDVVISTNLKLRQDDLPLGNQSQPADPASAVYFTLRFFRNGKAYDRPCVMTCDKWVRVEWNLYAIAKDIEAQRARARWGCGTVEQAFQGYVAIPEKCGGGSWWDILKISPIATIQTVESAYRALAKTSHPDKGGTHDQWVIVQQAYDQAMSQFRS